MTAPAMAKPDKGNRCCQCGTSVPGDELYCNRCGPRHLRGAAR